MSAFNNNDRTRKASLRSVFWSAMKQEFQRGFAEGFESTSGINLGATPAASATTTPAWTFTQAYTAPVQELTINGRPLSDVETLKLKIMGYQPLPNDYWYDKTCGAWGVKGGPCLGILPANLDFLGDVRPDASSPTTMTVFINGRLIHPKDWLKLATIGIIGTPGFYWLDANGCYGAQGNPLPTGILNLQCLACNDQPYAFAFTKRELDPQSLLHANVELMELLMRSFNIPNSSFQAGPSTSGSQEHASPSSPSTDYSRFFTQSDQARRERAAREARAAEEAKAAEAARKAREAREAARKRREAEAAARAKAQRQKAGWDRYIRGWQTLADNKRANIVISAQPRSQIPWPTDSGTFASCIAIDAASLEAFLGYGISSQVERVARMKRERERWHPDKIPRLFAQPVNLDEETMRVVTTISQLLNAWWDANKAT